MTNRLDEASRFFQNLYGDDNPEAPTIKLATASMTDRGKRTQKWHDPNMRLRLTPSDPDMMMGRLERFVLRSNKGEEIFFAPTPMKGNQGRKKDQALPSRVVFGDADNGLSEQARARLMELDATLIRSGGVTPGGLHKYHVYILLSRAVPPMELERLNRGLKALIDGDKFDCTTVLRIPGTVNHKYPDRPLVRIERLSETRHHPTNVAKWLDVPDDDTHTAGVEQSSTSSLPVIPEDFDPRRREYWRMRKTIRDWNDRYENDEVRHRYAAAVALVKDAMRDGLGVDVAYAFAMKCEPLLGKEADENGYSIQKDIAKTWSRESKAAPSGSLTVDDILESPQHQDAKDKTHTTPADESVFESPTPKAFTQGDGPNPYSSRGASRNYLDMAIFTSGDFKPPEPEFFSVDGAFFLLYRGMTHCIFGDSGSGKTWIVLAQIAEELKAGRRVKYIDFENGAMTIGHRLRNVLGVPAELLGPETFKYMWFSEKPDDAEVEDEADEAHDLVIIDGVDASLALWQKAMNSATEVREWYDSFPQKFASQGSTVVVIDHTSKGNRDKVDARHQEPGGTPAKLAVLTGAAYYVKPEDNRELIPGQRGVVQAYVTRKDKDGFLKSKARKDGHLFDFIIDTDEHGATIIEFNVAKNAEQVSPRVPVLSDEQRMVLEILNRSSSAMLVGAIKSQMTAASGTVSKVIQGLVANGYVHQDPAEKGNGKKNSITSLGRDVLAGKIEAKTPPAKKPKPGNGGAERECRVCRQSYNYKDDFVHPEEVGYTGIPTCRTCAQENIETGILRDGAEWARKKRESTERERDTHEEL